MSGRSRSEARPNRYRNFPVVTWVTGPPARGLRGPAPMKPVSRSVASRSRLISRQRIWQSSARVNGWKYAIAVTTRVWVSLNGVDIGAPAAARMNGANLARL